MRISAGWATKEDLIMEEKKNLEQEKRDRIIHIGPFMFNRQWFNVTYALVAQLLMSGVAMYYFFSMHKQPENYNILSFLPPFSHIGHVDLVDMVDFSGLSGRWTR